MEILLFSMHPTMLSYEIYASKKGFGVAFGVDYKIFFSIFRGEKNFFLEKKNFICGDCKCVSYRR